MNKTLAERFSRVALRNENKFLSDFRPKVRKNIRQALAGYDRNMKDYEQDNIEWIKDNLDWAYEVCEEDYFYDTIRVREGCIRAAMLLEDRTMNKEIYVGLVNSIKEDKEIEYLKNLGK